MALETLTGASLRRAVKPLACSMRHRGALVDSVGRDPATRGARSTAL